METESEGLIAEPRARQGRRADDEAERRPGPVYAPRGYAVQADLGAVTGAQAYLWARARTALDQMLPLVDGMAPLRADPDTEACASLRSLVRDVLVLIIDELARPDQPRVASVDSRLNFLVDWESRIKGAARDRGSPGF